MNQVHRIKGDDQPGYAEPWDAESPEEAAQREEETLSERLSAFVAKLQEEASRRVERRLTVEKRWMEDLRQYHGMYSPEIEETLKKKKGSRAFQNITRPKTNAMMARLWDLLFPTDDRNWGIRPTPVPEMDEKIEEALGIVDDAEDSFQAKEAELRDAEQRGSDAREMGDERAAGLAEEEAKAAAAEMEGLDQARSKAQAYADELHEIVNEATRRADLMQDEIDDQLKACSYQAECRDMIADACKIGTGILKGPVLGHKARERWERVTDEDGNPAGFAMVQVEENRPAAYRVDPWGFFPDPDANNPDDSEGFYERHMMSKSRMRKLARRPDIDERAVRSLLDAGARQEEAPAYLVDLHKLTNENDGTLRDAFQVWEYTGPIEGEDFVLLAQAFEDDENPAEIEDIDPLEEIHVKVWFCQDKVLSFGLHPLDSNEPIYSVFNLERDEYGPWGFGIPYLLRDPQAIMNGALRMMMDNAGLSTGPQIVVNKKAVSPVDGTWEITPRKVWERNDANGSPNQPAFDTYDIPSHQGELSNIMVMAAQAADEVTSMPQIAQGEQGAGVTKTAQGMAILMNSANVIFRRVVKNFDDDVSVKTIRRFYHWNMQFSDKEAIKGDYEVDARGSSVLLVREMQAQNLLMIAQMFGDHPVYGPLLKHENLLRQIFQAHMIASDEITRSERELRKFIKEQSEQGDPTAQAAMAELEIKKEEIALRREEMAQKAELSNLEWDARRDIAQMTFDAKMHAVAEALNMKHDELMMKLDMHESKTRSDERRLAAEIAEKRRTGVSAGGSI